jgi:D-sedoheptulose 7-phosphate isomerase
MDATGRRSPEQQTAELHAILNATFADSIAVKQQTLASCSDTIAAIADALESALRNGHKILLFGNGGSSSDAQHVAGELVGRFLMERRGLPAIALNTDAATMTSVSNDYGFEQVFARQVEALAQPGDVVVGITTSGNSPNVLRGVEKGRAQGAITIGFTGGYGGKLASVTDHCLCVPSPVTARVQETHITVWHVLCDVLERRLFGDKPAGEK